MGVYADREQECETGNAKGIWFCDDAEYATSRFVFGVTRTAPKSSKDQLSDARMLVPDCRSIRWLPDIILAST